MVRILRRRRPGHDRHAEEALAGLVAGGAATAGDRRSGSSRVPPKFVNVAAAWQVSQAAAPNGMCVAGGVTMVTPKKLLPLAWQVAQPDVMPAWFIAVPAKLVNLLAEWQVSHACGGRNVRRRRRDLGTTLAKLKPAAWQVAQPDVMPAWFIVPTA